jgi:hypothetical protein
MSTNTSATPIKKSETPDPAVSSPQSELLVRAAMDDIALVIGGAAVFTAVQISGLTERLGAAAGGR